ncbi:hypothetical protein KM043_017622 [Ampulex compressa]|nr:hypothetical protein KM043_017622 [Ampulex compressa]
MFLDLDGNVYDYFYGYEDLKKKKVVFVGDAACRLQEDYLRILRYFRFYGRIAEEPNNHNEGTIKAIKSNVAGLEKIPGERIWSEWRQILTGRYPCDITLKMIDCGLAPFIGLPKEPNVDALKLVCARAAENQLTLHPITMIAALLRDEAQAMNLQDRLKLSAYERKLALFLMQHRERKLCEKPLRPYQLLVILSTYPLETRSFVCEALKYIGTKELLRDFEAWSILRFPLNGHKIVNLLPHRKMTGQVMISLKELWMDTDCKATAQELLDHVPRIVMELQEKKL